MHDGAASQLRARDHLDAMRGAFEAGGAGAVVSFVEGFALPSERRQLYALAMQGLGRQDWPGKTLDGQVALARAAIAEGLRQADSEPDPEEAAKRLDFANALSYDLAADLAPCWPDDARPRERSHHEVGLAAADDCLRWRDRLGKPAGPRSMAFWARGIHLLALGRRDEALEAFERSRDLAREAAAAEGHGTGIDVAGHWSVLLGEGYVELARQGLGDAQAGARLDALLGTLERAADAQPAERDDLLFCREQLQVARGCLPCRMA
jgi:tetratricopeptide (TPR) repeat protein